jgi:protease I
MTPKILIVTGDGGESFETLYAWQRFREEGFEAVVAAPSVKRLHLVMHDFEPGWDTYVERPGYGLEAQIAIDDVRAEDYEAILIIGGRAPEYLRYNHRLLDTVRRMHAAGKWIFAICHGIQVLVAAGIVSGRSVTCYEHVRVEVENCGATWHPEQAVRDGNLVTAQTWESHPEFYREVMACLRSGVAA